MNRLKADIEELRYFREIIEQIKQEHRKYKDEVAALEMCIRLINQEIGVIAAQLEDKNEQNETI